MENIFIEFQNNNWYIKTSDGKSIKTEDEIRKFITGISFLKIDRCYYTKNFESLVLHILNNKIIIKNYDLIKDKEVFSSINKNIKKSLFITAIKKINKKFNLLKVGAIAVSTVVVVNVGTSIAKNKQDDNNFTTTSIQSDDNSDVKADENLKADNLVSIEYTTNPVKVENHPIVHDDSSEIEEKIDSDILNLFNVYSNIYGINDYVKEKLINENIENLTYSKTQEEDIINLLHDYYETNLYLDIPINYNTYTDIEQQEYILKYAVIFGVDQKDVLATMLAVHVLESGHGESEICRNQNNLGGIFWTNPYTKNWETKKYPNIDSAAIDFVKTFLRIKKSCEELDTYNPNDSLEHNMNYKYCTLVDDPYTPDWNWSERVTPIKNEILNSGILDNYISKNY